MRRLTILRPYFSYNIAYTKEPCYKIIKRLTARAKEGNYMRDFLNGKGGDDVNARNMSLGRYELKSGNPR
jgi:hypothetical protein